MLGVENNNSRLGSSCSLKHFGEWLMGRRNRTSPRSDEAKVAVDGMVLIVGVASIRLPGPAMTTCLDGDKS
jgi:hypothetical protein